MQSDGGFWDESVATRDVVRDDGVGQQFQDRAWDDSGQAERAWEIGFRSLGPVRGEADTKVARGRDTSLEVGWRWEVGVAGRGKGQRWMTGEVEARGGGRGWWSGQTAMMKCTGRRLDFYLVVQASDMGLP